MSIEIGDTAETSWAYFLSRRLRRHTSVQVPKGVYSVNSEIRDLIMTTNHQKKASRWSESSCVCRI